MKLPVVISDIYYHYSYRRIFHSILFSIFLKRRN
nr:MAG TPA: hypothetical protein [Caudoviricetes sp.]